jgi:hypothetical protein
MTDSVIEGLDRAVGTETKRADVELTFQRQPVTIGRRILPVYPTKLEVVSVTHQ